MKNYFSFTKELFDPSKIPEKAEVLKGIRVLDFSHVIFGPTPATVLARYGAEVIKIELPFYGELWRTGVYWGHFWKHSNPIWHWLQQNKYFATIDLKLPKGKELIHKLAQNADVVVENFGAGTAEAWGVGYSQLSQVNPKIIYLSCSTYGQYGPLRFFPGWDLLAQAASGVVGLTGYPGTDKFYKLPDYIGDYIPGNISALCILMALYHRQKTGKGQYIDFSQAESLIRLLPNYTYSSITNEELERVGNTDPTMAPSGIFKCKDGKFIALAAATDGQFETLTAAMNQKDLAQDERFKEAFERLKPENAAELNKITEKWVSSKDSTEIITLANTQGFPAAEVMDDLQITNDEWRRQRGSVIEFHDEMYGKVVVAGPLAMLSKTPARTKWTARPLGYHNRYVFKKIMGLSQEEIEKLQKERVISYWDDTPGLKPPVYYDMEKDAIFNYRGDEES